MNDPVKHPEHYTSHPSGVECIQITRHMNFCCGNVVKYLWRHGLKDAHITGKMLEDLQKARQYLDFEIERIKELQSSSIKSVLDKDFDPQKLDLRNIGSNFD